MENHYIKKKKSTEELYFLYKTRSAEKSQVLRLIFKSISNKTTTFSKKNKKFANYLANNPWSFFWLNKNPNAAIFYFYKNKESFYHNPELNQCSTYKIKLVDKILKFLKNYVSDSIWLKLLLNSLTTLVYEFNWYTFLPYFFFACCATHYLFLANCFVLSFYSNTSIELVINFKFKPYLQDKILIDTLNRFSKRFIFDFFTFFLVWLSFKKVQPHFNQDNNQIKDVNTLFNYMYFKFIQNYKSRWKIRNYNKYVCAYLVFSWGNYVFSLFEFISLYYDFKLLIYIFEFFYCFGLFLINNTDEFFGYVITTNIYCLILLNFFILSFNIFFFNFLRNYKFTNEYTRICTSIFWPVLIWYSAW